MSTTASNILLAIVSDNFSLSIFYIRVLKEKQEGKK